GELVAIGVPLNEGALLMRSLQNRPGGASRRTEKAAGAFARKMKKNDGLRSPISFGKAAWDRIFVS
uniref:hypothetical protein n=1 Tax=Acinetobacter baumannii TaxID=470 RepID=UPI001C08BD92